ncbi:MAG TPA: branched-chain amino acid ABC transporter permease [Eoetvoesiella sp.]|uniref:branched-chain amino acid ABC transporter permease n=1 Tax=Eoetvoesiella sp. TaxID=1966355 RepID=UPI002C7F46EB|nr:branched-chain amino acid ABC transporter permease [Eoetvoesiella sp.]HWK60858.1 branched-chain amino acid ABC transporter permease [Eoetvoesiella sp.]
MDLAMLAGIQILYAIASLFLISVGLAIIFGMMGVINFAHGEFLMLGGFAFILSVRAGVNFWVAMFVVAPLAVAFIGVVIERLIIRHLYGRIVETILATWGLSLLLIGLASSLFGYYQMGVSPPLGSVQIGAYQEGGYTFFVIGVAVAVAVGLYFLLRHTPFGLIARGTMQSADMASALGVNVKRVYSVTFGIGAALSGLAGAIFAPLTGVLPISGLTYIAKAFITVILGGALPLTGAALSSALLGTVSQATTLVSTSVLGEVMLLVTAIVLLRVLPSGITGRFFKRGI